MRKVPPNIMVLDGNEINAVEVERTRIVIRLKNGARLEGNLVDERDPKQLVNDPYSAFDINQVCMSFHPKGQ